MTFSYAQTRDNEQLRLLTPAVHAFIAGAQSPPATTSTTVRASDIEHMFLMDRSQTLGPARPPRPKRRRPKKPARKPNARRSAAKRRGRRRRAG